MSTDTSYDELPYPILSFAQTHPNRTAACARFFGFHTPTPSRCRVLEIGCAQGGNLLPMAVEMPDAEFLGIDLSASQIEHGQATLAANGIANATLRQANLMDIDDSWGKFDYIIAHGVYSWVPPTVQTKLLEVCRRNLIDNGLAYVSYNCYPGWRIKGMIRDMMLFHTGPLKTATEKVQQARALLDFLADSAPQDSPYGALLRSEAAFLRAEADSYLFHEFLEFDNSPLYFHQFAEAADAAGLKYLGETNLPSMFNVGLDPKTVATLDQLGSGNILRSEQYMDFLRNQPFRQTLLVHREALLRRDIGWQALDSLCLSFFTSLSAEAFDANDSGKVEFSTPSGFKFEASEPVVKAALQVLMEAHPQAVSFAALVDGARARLKSSTAKAAEIVGTHMGRLLAFNVIELAVEPWRCSTTVGEKPRTSRLVRYQVDNRLPVTTLRHQRATENPLIWQLLPLLDGEHSVEDLVESLFGRTMAGKLQVKQEGKVVNDVGLRRQLIRDDVTVHLQGAQHMGLLM